MSPRRPGPEEYEEGPGPLFEPDDDSEEPLPPSHAHPRSLGAAESVRDRAAHDCARILMFILERGARGSTSDEAQAALGLSHQTGSARFVTLSGRDRSHPHYHANPAIVETTKRRPTRSGRLANVYVHVAYVGELAPESIPPPDSRLSKAQLRARVEELEAEVERLRGALTDARNRLAYVRTWMHADGKRPETHHPMSEADDGIAIADAALRGGERSE